MLRGVELWETTKQLVRNAGQIMRERRVAVLVCIAVVAMGCSFLFSRDLEWNRQLTTGRSNGLKDFAFQVSRWGDLPTGTFIIAGGLLLAGFAGKRRDWRTAGVACLLAASVAGLSVKALSASLGRPRPNKAGITRLQGPTLNRDFQSFPSGHSATSFGTAGALAVVLPPVGVPVLVGAVGVGWSRLYLGAHYPSDVWTGAWVGLVTGLALGLAARRCRLGSTHGDSSTTQLPRPDR